MDYHKICIELIEILERQGCRLTENQRIFFIGAASVWLDNVYITGRKDQLKITKEFYWKNKGVLLEKEKIKDPCPNAEKKDILKIPD